MYCPHIVSLSFPCAHTILVGNRVRGSCGMHMAYLERVELYLVPLDTSQHQDCWFPNQLIDGRSTHVYCSLLLHFQVKFLSCYKCTVIVPNLVAMQYSVLVTLRAGTHACVYSSAD